MLRSKEISLNKLNISTVRTLSTKEVQDLTENLLAMQERRSLMENLVNQIHRLKGEPLDVLESIPAVLKHPLMQNLKKEEAKVKSKYAELGKRYGPQHPKMLAAKSELDAIHKNMQEQIKVVIAGIEKEYEIARDNERSIKTALEKTKKEIQKINRKEFQLKELEREVETARKLYDTFFTRFQETSATGDLETVNARIMDPAVVPQIPAKPKKGLSLVIAFAISLILGVLMAFLLEHLDNTFKGSDDVEERLGVPVLGLIPLAKTGKKHRLTPREIFSDNDYASLAEAVRTIRTGLILSGLDNPHKVALVTSSVPNEGKTTTSASLAIALGHLENVLLVDADMRHPSIARLFDIKPDAPGLSDLVAGTKPLHDCIHHNADANIDVLPAGTLPPNPLELLSSERFASVLQELEQKYDRIVIDSAPTQAVSDPLVISAHANAVLYVVKADATQFNVVKSGVKRLLNNNAPLTGIVLNQLDIDKAAKYGYYSYYKGGYYGGYTGKKPEQVKT